MQESKFKIELNKGLNVKHFLTKCDGEEVEDPKLFESFTCYLNFNDDAFQFKYHVKTFQWKGLSKVTKRVSYEKVNSDTYRTTALELPIVNDESTSESNYIIVSIEANFKDVLLNIFSPHKKEVKFFINYKFEFSEYRSIFHVKIPNIDQNDWYAGSRLSRAQVYEPEATGGFDLVRLFKKNFSLSIDSPQDESKLCCKLLDYINATTKEKFDNFDYLQIFRTMLVISDLEKTKEMENFSLTLQNVVHYTSASYSLCNAVERRLRYLMCESKMRNMLYQTFIINASKKLPYDAQVFDYIYITDMQDYQQHHDSLHEIADQRILGKIYYIFGDLILFQLTYRHRRAARRPQQQAILDETRLYHIQFVPNRIAIRVAHQSIETSVKNQLSNYLKDFTGQILADTCRKTQTEFKFFNPAVASNKEQKSAVKNIFNRTSFPSPYIIFGPPGTGKSTTVVEAIAQIVSLRPNIHILVTAGSNAACDDIGNRLLKYVSINKILRLYSPAFDKKPEKVDKSLEPISNFRNRFTCACNRRSCPEIEPCDDPTYEEFYTARIIIATLVSCGRIVSAGIRSDHFDYIFIDEAASECEQYTLIPIAGLGSDSRVVTAQIVLSGDHKQLGPIVPSKFCCKMGMEKSMMERIMETNVNYQRVSELYNPVYVTQLVKNYRSHPAILQFSNENFYDSKLQFKCPKRIADFACGWDFLLTKNFPILFITTRAPSTEVGLSLMNEGEVKIVKNYIKVLLAYGIKGQKIRQADIGIISPYRAQRDRMNEIFGTVYPGIEIGTVDSFQGREKKIIIMSTVRSGTRHVGFLRNQKRLNVALTRARCLLIIIGNSATLQKCSIWNKFIAYCDNNKAIVGDASSIDRQVIHDNDYQGNELKPEVEDEFAT